MFFNLVFCHFTIILLIILNCVNSQLIQASVNAGKLEGRILKTKSGFPYCAFSGIPYAQPPVGKLRFRAPIPIRRWSGILNATKEGNMCAQFNKIFLGAEDCLYLNVYVPNSIKRSQKLPVMFWTHGGTFMTGSGNRELYGPDYLIEHNVIIVTINYRLGALGYLSLDMVEAPGNVALRDQILALKWVNANIHGFGGNPKDVTIFGQSSGSVATNFIILTNLTRGMYSKVILESGTSQNVWALQRNYIDNSFKLGALLGIECNDKRQLLNSLLNITVEQLVKASTSPTLGSKPPLPAFVPIIEKKIPSIPTVVSKDPHILMQSIKMNNVPVMIGFMTEEGLIGLKYVEKYVEQFKPSNGNLSTLSPDFTYLIASYLNDKYDETKIRLAAKMIQDFYFPTEENFLDNLVNLMSDFGLIKDINSAAKIFARQTDTYFYKFAFHGSLNLFQYSFPLPYKGAAHGDELGYLFYPDFEKLSINPPSITDREILTIKRMSTMWTNFAKYGNPTPTMTKTIDTIWKKISKNDLDCLCINDNLTMIKNPLEKRMKFWDSLERL